MMNEYIPLVLGVIVVAFLGSLLWQILELLHGIFQYLQGMLHYLETINNVYLKYIKDNTPKSSDQKINQQTEEK